MEEDNPWKTHSSRIVYENPWMKVREDSVTRPDGNPGIYSVIETRIATGVVALDQDNRIYLVGQYRYPTRQYSWEIPEGGTDPNETPLQAAKRELREEAGLEAREFSQLGAPLHLSNCLSAEVGVLFLARGLVEVERDPDPTEILEVRRIAFESALKMVDVGEITDAMSVIGILRAARL